jgi:hypothetical protein
MPAIVVVESSIKWGQNGSAVPDHSVLMYVSIAAILAWFVASCIAITKLILALWAWRHSRL